MAKRGYLHYPSKFSILFVLSFFLKAVSELTFEKELSVIGDTIYPLSGVWSLSNSSVSLNATVPGDLVSSLALGGLYPGPDPLYGMNSKAFPIYNQGLWTFSTTFPSPVINTSYMLVIEGCKMASFVSLNNHSLGNTSSQFLRYVFDVSSVLVSQGTLNTLEITFPPYQHPLNSENRWMVRPLLPL